LGLPLSAAFVFGRTEADATDIRFMHLFFDLGDGNHIAFFDEPTHVTESDFDKKHGFDIHIAFECADMAELGERRQKLTDAGVETSQIDHGFLTSIYFYDPNGLRLELTVKSADYADVMRASGREAHTVIDCWLDETRATKVKRLGADALEKRPTTVALPSL
jgi:catechol 2,3-dioxygenase-like lactoylglutathione lyase family enzyme